MSGEQTVYVYNEHCVMSGNIVHDPDQYIDEDGVVSDDISQWGIGSKDQLVERATGELARRYDMRPGGAGDAYRWKCARNVLKHFGIE